MMRFDFLYSISLEADVRSSAEIFIIFVAQDISPCMYSDSFLRFGVCGGYGLELNIVVCNVEVSWN